MKIVFTGGGTGGHFYPIIAVAEEIQDLVREKNLVKPQLYFLSTDPYDEEALFRNSIEFRSAPAGKIRKYFSIQNAFDIFKTGWGIIQATFQLYAIFPDVVFSKGGYASFPTVVAAHVLGIPIIIHDSDAVPGQANLLAAKFAKRIAISYPSAAEYFDKSKVAFTGIPIRKEVKTRATEGAFEYLGLQKGIPTILILGGSQGAKRINETVLTALPDLVRKYQVIHQTGAKHLDEVKGTADVILENNRYRSNYHPHGFLNALAYKMSAGAADLIIGRSGSTTIYEVATWGMPSIFIPLPEEISRDQRKNAYAFARTGASIVLEEQNLTPNLLVSEIDRIIENKKLAADMAKKATTFAQPNAARMIADELLTIALEHEQ